MQGPPSNSYRPPTHNTASNPLPYPTGNSPYPVGNTMAYPGYNANPYSSNARNSQLPPYPGTNLPPYPGGSGTNLPPYPSSNLPPQRPAPPVVSTASSFEHSARPTNYNNQSSIDNSLLVDSQKEYQIERINNYLVAQGDEIRKNTTDEIKTLTESKEGLEQRERLLNEHFISMKNEKAELETKIAKLDSIISIKEEEVEKVNKNISEGINPDEIIQANTPLERQILKSHSEDLAISDAVYYLNSALQRDLLDVDQFLREVRKLGRKQFQLRATIKKARQVGGLNPL